MKNNVIKFSLTLAASAILAACSSSSGSSSNGQQVAADVGPTGTPAVGYKVVNKDNSDFRVKGRTDTARNSEAGAVESMLTQNPEPSFDTLVIAAPTTAAGQKSIAYVEDLDVTNPVNGVAQLQHIYIGTQTKNGGVARTEGVKNEYGHITKTTTKGQDTGSVLVYENGRLDYTGDAGRIKKSEFPTNDTVAELYGRNTMNSDKLFNANANLPLADHYGVSTAKRGDGHLQYVQYGRVTTELDSSKLAQGDDILQANFKDGVKLGGNLKTYVVAYGEFNAAEKEDNYFARGISNISEKDLAELQGKLTYKGHAVTYGLDHGLHADVEVDKNNAPTALQGVNPDVVRLVSGTHVIANVDLASRNVTGKLYDVYSVNSTTKESDLVNFNGTLGKNGAIQGSSELAYGKADAANRKGTFNATIYGNKADGLDKTELGGAVASNIGDADKKWGAVFGAEDVTKKVVAPTPTPTPANPLAQAENAQQGTGTVNKVN